MSEVQNPGLIYKLIPAVMRDVSAVEKKGKNAAQNYTFRGIDDVMAAFHPVLAKHGVFYIPEVLSSEITERQNKSGGALIYTTLTIAYTFFAEDGSAVRAVVVGEAMDSGDKSSNKAMSAALKYALLQIFCVPTAAQEDADYESHEVAPRVNQVESKNLDRSIVEACGVLGKTEDQLMDWVSKKYGVSKLSDLTVPQKREVLKFLNNKVDKLAATG